MPTTQFSTECPVTWSPDTSLPMSHLILPELMASITRGLEQVTRGEWTELDPSELLEDEGEEE